MKNRSSAPSPWKRAAGFVFYTIFCGVALMLGIGAAWINQSPILRAALSQITRNIPPQEVFRSNSLTLLVLGCDEDRAPGGDRVVRRLARSDMMLLVKLDFDKMRVGGVSIPRDLEVDVPGYRPQKINAYHSIGGKQLAKEAVQQVIPVVIDHVIVIDYEAFRELVDMVGGVTVFVEKRIKYDDAAGDLHINLEPGRRHLDGYEAMGFVRFRHSDSDFKRIERQREFLFALKQAVIERKSMLPAVTNKTSEVIGDELKSDEVAALALFVQKVPNDSIRLRTVPVLSGRGSNLVLNRDELDDVLAETYLMTPNRYGARFSN